MRKNHLDSNSELFRYVNNNINGVTISIDKLDSTGSTTVNVCNLDRIPAMQMCKTGKLEGWCWESTTFLSIFFDDSIVSRGELSLYSWSFRPYFHAWIEIVYKNKNYVFDPALSLLMDRKKYYSKLVKQINEQVESNKIREALINCINNNTESSYSSGYVHVPSTGYLTDPLFRVNSDLCAEVDGQKIKKLDVRFINFG